MSQEAPEDIVTVLNNLIDSQLVIQNDEVDMRIFEEILFSDLGRTYNTLDQEATTSVLKAINEGPPSRKFQCSNCEKIFSNDDFQRHVCLFDENHNLISMEQEPQLETHLQKMHRVSMDLIMKNQSMMNRFHQRDVSAKSSGSKFECVKCSRNFVYGSGLFRHMDMHIGDLISPSPGDSSDQCKSVFLCNICHEIFGCESDAWDHYLQKRHDEFIGKQDRTNAPENLVEDNSPTSEVNRSEGPARKKLKEGVVKPSSPILSMSSNVQCALRSVHVSKFFQCEFCDLVFFSGPAMLKHVSMHDPVNAFECNKCELKNLSLKEILLHRQDECLIFHDVLNPFRDMSRVWVCNVCEDEFRGLEPLLDHRHSNHHFYPRVSARNNKLLFSCERCVIHYETASKLVDHFYEKHLKKTMPDEVAKTSERKTPKTNKGGVHQTSTRDRRYLCEVCGKSYTQSSHLWQHLRFHKGVKPFECPVKGCDRRFTISPDLKDHVRKCHTGERPYLCMACGKRFLTGSVYYQHRLIHRGERRYGCEECNKRFYRADALKNHTRIHTGEKPYSCNECFREFRQRGDRDKHFRSRHPNSTMIASPRKQRIISFGLGRVRDNISLYCSKPGAQPFIPKP